MPTPTVHHVLLQYISGWHIINDVCILVYDTKDRPTLPVSTFTKLGNVSTLIFLSVPHRSGGACLSERMAMVGRTYFK